MDATCQLETITPELARKWLDGNTGNFRTLDKKRVTNYFNEMKSGNWDVNGETIKFNEQQLLLDGQHRLTACVESGVTFKSFVVRNLIADAKHIDRGQPRTIAQWIKRSGVKNAKVIASAARHVVAHDKGIWETGSWSASFATDSEVIEFAIKWQDELNTCIPPRGIDISVSAFTAVMFVGDGRRNIDECETAMWFRDAFANGESITNTDPVYHLREKCKASSTRGKIDHHTARMLLTLAWNKTVKGEECGPRGLNIRLTGPSPQKKPNEILVAE